MLVEYVRPALFEREMLVFKRQIYIIITLTDVTLSGTVSSCFKRLGYLWGNFPT